MDLLKSVPDETEQEPYQYEEISVKTRTIKLHVCDGKYTKNIFTFRQVLSSDIPSDISVEINETFEGLADVVLNNFQQDFSDNAEMENITPQSLAENLNVQLQIYINAVFTKYAASLSPRANPIAALKVEWEPVEGGCLTPIDEARRHERSPS